MPQLGRLDTPDVDLILNGNATSFGASTPDRSFNRGVDNYRKGELRSAEAQFRATIASDPSRIEARLYLARTLALRGERPKAQDVVRSAIESNPYHADAVHLLGAMLCEDLRFLEAFPWLRLAASLEPGRAQFERDLGVVELFFGDLERGRASLHRALALDPLSDSVLTTLIRMTPMGDGTEEAGELFRLAGELERNLSSLSPHDQVQLLFALGKAHEDRSEYDAAFEAISRANRLRRGMVRYDRAAARERFAAIAGVFNTDLFRRFEPRARGSGSQRPIFILGLPRSGTSLVEQIVSSHSDVYGGGEIDILRAVAEAVHGLGGEAYPQWAATLNEVDLKQIATTYLDALPKGPDGQSRTTEKFLTNYEYIGLIHLCLPNAVIINCQRDLRDCGWSAYATPFVAEQEFSHDLEELGEYYRLYCELMAHWRRVLPPGRIMDVPYEQLVADQKGWTRKILAHCGLGWDPACLDFHRSRRMVRSASVTQVRQPLYDTSIGRSKPFEPYLEPFLSALGAPWNA